MTGAKMQDLILSMVRFSTAVTLYGYEQLQSAYSMSQKGADLLRNADQLEDVLNSLTDSLADRLDPAKQETLKSFTEMARDAVNRSTSAAGLMDPRVVLRAVGDLARKSAETVSGWVPKSEEPEPSEPVAAADVLDSRGHPPLGN
jgi:hypothetical protein